MHQQVAKLWAQQQRRTDRVAELQAEEERVTMAIHPVHVEFKKVVDTTVVDVSKHLSSEIVEGFAKVKTNVP